MARAGVVDMVRATAADMLVVHLPALASIADSVTHQIDRTEDRMTDSQQHLIVRRDAPTQVWNALASLPTIGVKLTKKYATIPEWQTRFT